MARIVDERVGLGAGHQSAVGTVPTIRKRFSDGNKTSLASFGDKVPAGQTIQGQRRVDATNRGHDDVGDRGVMLGIVIERAVWFDVRETAAQRFHDAPPSAPI